MLIASLLFAAPAAVVSPPRRTQMIQGWRVDITDTKLCEAQSGFGARTVLSAWTRPNGDNGLILFLKGSSLAVGREVAPIVEVGERTYRGSTAKVIDAEGDRGFAMQLDAGFLKQLERSTAIRIHLDENTVRDGDPPLADLSFEAPVQMVAALARCAGRTVPDAPIIAQPAATAPTFLNKPAIISADDYPTAALRAGAQGRVAYRIVVALDGKVGDCAVVSGSGNAELNSKTCELLLRRAKLSPGKDPAGQPVVATLDANVYWKLP